MSKIFDKLVKWFFQPIVDARPPNFDVEAWLHQIFHTRTRHIEKYRVLESFKLPGLFMEAALVRREGLGNRLMNRGQILWVRTDDTIHDFIEIEPEPKDEQYTQVFRLESHQWMAIRPKLKKIHEDKT